MRAAGSEQDAAIFLTAAFTGLRQGELLALCWRDVDFERRIVRVHRTYKSGNGVDTPKSGRGRAVPMADEVAQALARLGEREYFTEDDDLVFRGPRGHVNAQKLGYRYKAALKRAGLRELRFHDMRHTFGTIAINRADIVQVQAWMGHADLKTTQRYLHYKARGQRSGTALWCVRRWTRTTNLMVELQITGTNRSREEIGEGGTACKLRQASRSSTPSTTSLSPVVGPRTVYCAKGHWLLFAAG